MIVKLIKKINYLYLIWKFKNKNKGLHKSVALRNPRNIVLGKNCNIGENSYILCWDQYNYRKTNQKLGGQLCIGDDFSATRRLTIQCCNHIMIGNDVLIASDVFICDYNHGTDPNRRSYRENELALSTVKICDGVWIGQGVYILPGVTIGKHAIIGAGSVVTQSIPAYSMAVGNPAKVIKKYNKVLQCWESI